MQLSTLDVKAVAMVIPCRNRFLVAVVVVVVGVGVVTGVPFD